MNNRNNLLIPKRSIYNVIGSLCKNPQLLIQEGIELKEKDFAIDYYRIMFAVINNMIIDNIKIEKITDVDIDNALAQIPKLYKIYEQNNGNDFIRSAIEHSNTDLFESDYKNLKKFTLLRDFQEKDFGIREIIDIDNNIDLELQTKQLEKIQKMDLEDIIEHFNLKMLNIKNEWCIEGNKKSYDASEGLDDLLSRLNKDPEMGYPFSNGYYNTIFRGMRKSKLLIRSAGTGVGKTRLALADICNISCDELFDMQNMKWVNNGPSYGTCFISTELELEELQTCMLAYISGVSEEVIRKGRYSGEIFKRIKYAIEVLKRAPISLHYIDDFGISDIEQIIEKDILEKDVEYVFFDYIQLAPKLARTMQEAYGMGLREDQILVNLSSRLKLLCNKYNVYLATATQLNRSAKEHENRDSSAIRGSSAIIDKADHAIMCFRATGKDVDNLKHILDTGRYLKPNFAHYVYKNRSGRNAIIVWTKINYENMREELSFVTSMDFELMPLDPTFIKIGEQNIDKKTDENINF